MLKLLIVDDHALFREGLCHVLRELDEQADILEAPDYERALQHAAATPELDLVLLDLNMPGKDGFTALDSFATRYPTLPVVILSASSLRSDIQRALDAGAMGYIPKDTTSAIMLGALRLILAGGIYIPPNLAQDAPAALDRPRNRSALTPRQLDVLALLVQGISNKDIATRLGLSEGTVKMHVTSIFRELGVSNRTQATLAAQNAGLDLPSV